MLSLSSFASLVKNFTQNSVASHAFKQTSQMSNAKNFFSLIPTLTPTKPSSEGFQELQNKFKDALQRESLSSMPLILMCEEKVTHCYKLIKCRAEVATSDWNLVASNLLCTHNGC